MTATRVQTETRPGLSIASICRTLPTPDDPYSGIFVLRRLSAMSRMAKLHVVQPIPYFPLLRPLPSWARQVAHETSRVEVEHAPMFYLPGIFKRLDGRWLYRAIKNRLRTLHEQESLDIVDAHFAYPDGVGALRAAREIGIPAVVTVRGVAEDYLKSPGIARQIKAMLRDADGCICVSHSLRESMMAAGCDDRRLRVIHNAIDRDLFRPRQKSAARSKIGVSEDDRLIVSVGNLLSVKRHDVLIEAFAAAARRADRLRLVIIGGTSHEPKYPARLRRLVNEHGVADRVRFAGRMSPAEVADWLAAADVFALASRREGCCNAILEALACGVPVVATAVGDNPWFVKDGDNGFTVPPDDAGALAQAIGRVLARTEWDRERISAGLDVGDWSRVAGEVIQFLSEISSEAHRARAA